jgi:outer membrane murein-binding lipoprotein Lpp
MRTPISHTAALALGFAAFSLGQALPVSRALAADCSQGAVEERLACLSQAVDTLEAKVADLTKQLEAKAETADALKWNDRIALINEDMRIYPRCLDNPGPNSPDLTAVVANSCAKVPAQTWMISKPYH